MFMVMIRYIMQSHYHSCLKMAISAHLVNYKREYVEHMTLKTVKLCTRSSRRIEGMKKRAQCTTPSPRTKSRKHDIYSSVLQ